MYHIHVCLLFLENECIGPWRKGSYTGHQSLDIFQIFWKPNCAKIGGKKVSSLGHCYNCTYRGKTFLFPRFCLIAPERKHLHCVVMIGNTCEPHPTQLSPSPSSVCFSPSLPLSGTNQKETKQNLVFPSQSWQGSLQWINYRAVLASPRNNQ